MKRPTLIHGDSHKRDALLEHVQMLEHSLAGALDLIHDIHEEVRDYPDHRPVSTDSYLPPEFVHRLAATLHDLLEHMEPEEVDAIQANSQ